METPEKLVHHQNQRETPGGEILCGHLGDSLGVRCFAAPRGSLSCSDSTLIGVDSIWISCWRVGGSFTRLSGREPAANEISEFALALAQPEFRCLDRSAGIGGAQAVGGLEEQQAEQVARGLQNRDRPDYTGAASAVEPAP